MWDYLDENPNRFTAYKKITLWWFGIATLTILVIWLYPRLNDLHLPTNSLAPAIIPNDGYNPAEDWQVYHHPQLPLEFYYPAHYQLTSRQNEMRLILTSPLEEESSNIKQQDIQIIIDFYQKQPREDLKDKLKQIQQQHQNQSKVEILDEYQLTVGQQPAYHWTEINPSTKIKQEYYLVQINRNYLLLIQKRPLVTNQQNVFNEFLSLIRFPN